jgi:chromosome segregation ATPase
VLTQYSSNICSYNQELRSIDEKFHQSDESWSQGEESFSHQIASNCVHQIFTENDPKEAVKLLKKIEKSSQKTEKYIQEKEEYLQVMKKYFREKAELLQEKAKLLQETAELLPNRLNSAKLIKKLNKGLFAYKLKSASSDFKELLSKLENELENQVDSQNMNLDKRSRDKKITELDQEINSVLKELDLGPSKKLSQAKRITKAEESLKSKHSEIDEAIQKIRRKNEGLQLEEGNLQKELDQLGKNTDRYNPYWVENHHEEQRDMIHQISEGGLKSIKIYLKNVSKGAVG